MKTMDIDPEKDLPIKVLNDIFEMALALYD